MNKKLHLTVTSLLMLVALISSNVSGSESWYGQFIFDSSEFKSLDSVLTLDDVLKLVVAENRMFLSLSFLLKAAESNLTQAGLKSNPELSTELEGFSWDSPGFRDSELSISLSQEFEIFGQRDARENVARTEIVATHLKIKQLTFELYLETKHRFYTYFYIQQQVMLADASLSLAKEIVGNITHRLNRGAALQSELLLAQLEEQRVNLELEQTKQELLVAEIRLVSLWNGKLSSLQLSVSTEPDFSNILVQVAALSKEIDSTSSITQLRNDEKILQAELHLAVVEVKPAITLSGGFKRLQSDNSNSFLFGISLLLPFFNRNQGVKRSIDATRHSLEYEVERKKIEMQSSICSQEISIKQLIDKHVTLDSLLLPTAENAYRTLQRAYEAGRVPYTQLLEAERSLNKISFEHNDILLKIQDQIITMEDLTGVALRINKE